MSIFRIRGTRAHAASMVACIALLSACGGNPEPVETNTAAAADEVLNATANLTEAAENVVVANEVAPAAEAPAEKAPAAEAAPAPAAAAPAPAAAAPAAETASAGNAANGAKLFAQCRICHAVEPGKNGLGPSLHGVVGRTAGTLAGFNFSNAMKGSGVVWTEETLSDYLRAPMKFMPGTKMAYAGMANETQRADMYAYLESLK